MEKKLQEFVNKAFAPYGDFPGRADVTKELVSNLQEKYADLKTQGLSDQEAYTQTVDSFGDVDEIMEHVPHTNGQAKESTSTPKSVGKSLKEIFKAAKRSTSNGAPYWRAIENRTAASSLRSSW